MDKSYQIVFTVTNAIRFDQRMQRICATLQHNGFNVLLVGRAWPKNVLKPDLDFDTFLIRCIFNKGFLFYAEFNIRLFLFLLKTTAKSFSAIDLDTILAVRWAAYFKKVPFYFDAHEYFTETPEVAGRKFVKSIWNIIALTNIKHAKVCYTVGEALANIFKKQYNKTFEVLPNVPFMRTVNKLGTEKPYILYQGALNESRGLEQCILAMHHIHHAQLVIAGEGDLSQALRDLVQTEKLNNKVIFKGYVEPNELKALTDDALIGLNLLEKNGLSYYYSLANKFFDYIMSEVPQICAPFPEYEIINNKFNIAILTDCNSSEIARNINALLTNTDVYLTLQNNCKKAKQEYCWENYTQSLLSIYQAHV